MAEPGAPAGPCRHERAEWLAGAARVSAGVMAKKFIAGATPDEAMQTVLALRAPPARVHGRLARRGGDQRGRGRPVPGDVPGLDPRPGRTARLGPRDPPDRPRPERPDSARQPLAQAVEPDRSVRRRSTPRRRSSGSAGGCGRSCARPASWVRIFTSTWSNTPTGRSTYELFCRVLEEPEFRDWPDVGIVVQAYHADAESELRMLREWVERRGAPITIRLVKGAYWDYEVLTARRLGWPEPVYLQKWQSDASFERCARFLIEHHDQLRPAFGSHNVRSLAHAIAAAEALGLPPVGLRAPNALRHGRPDPARPGRPRPSRAGLHALRRHAAGHGLPGAAAAGEYVERVVLEGEFRRERADRRPAARSRGDRMPC